MTYATGDTLKATYNSIGQMVAEKWYDSESATTPIAHYKYVYDGQGNIVRSIDMTARKEYTYTYESSNLTRAAEYHITVGADEIITAKNLVNSIIYVYDAEGNMTRKRIIAQSILNSHASNRSVAVPFYLNLSTLCPL